MEGAPQRGLTAILSDKACGPFSGLEAKGEGGGVICPRSHPGEGQMPDLHPGWCGSNTSSAPMASSRQRLQGAAHQSPWLGPLSHRRQERESSPSVASVCEPSCPNTATLHHAIIMPWGAEPTPLPSPLLSNGSEARGMRPLGLPALAEVWARLWDTGAAALRLCRGWQVPKGTGRGGRRYWVGTADKSLRAQG